MKIYEYVESQWELSQMYTPWGGAKYNYNLIVKNNNLDNFLEDLEEYYPDGLDKTELNDILWFEDGMCYQYVNDEFLDEDELEIKRSW